MTSLVETVAKLISYVRGAWPAKVAALALLGAAHVSPAGAQTWSTGYFNTNAGYVRGYSIIATNQPSDLRWQGNDPYDGFNGETDVIQFATGYTPSPLANSSLLQGGSDIANGVLPGTNQVRIWKSFVPLAAPTVSFSAEWSLVPSLLPGPYNLKDTFSFDLRNSANTQSLLSLQFTPDINLLANAYTLQTIAAGSPTATLIDLGYQSLFQIQVDITGSTYDLSLQQLNSTNRSVIVQYDLVSGASLATGSTAADFGTVSIDWVLSSGNPAEPGSNFIIVNDVSVVPEPSTYALLLLSGAIAAAMLRRRG